MTLMLSVTACGKSEAAQATDDLISSIGEVTLDSEAKIVAAESAVEVLADKDREQLEMQAVLIAARSAYDALEEDAKAFVANASVLTDAETTLSDLRVQNVTAPIYYIRQRRT